MDNYTKHIKEIAKKMNMQSTINVPLVPSIIKTFKKTFTEEEIEILNKLEPHIKYQLDDFSFINKETLEKFFNRGVIWFREDQNKSGYYELAPIFPGWIEVALSGDLDQERLEILEEFKKFEDFLTKINIKPIRAYLNHQNMMRLNSNNAHMSTYVNLDSKHKKTKKIDVDINIESTQKIISKSDVINLLKKHENNLGLMNCFCRVSEKLHGHECKFKMNDRTCINVGAFAQSMIEHGISEKITLDKAIEIVEDCSKKGAIHTIFHYNNDVTQEEVDVCNCCMDCCFVYGAFNRGSISNIFIKAYYEPRIYNEKNCVGCNLCGKYCPTKATYYDKDNHKLILNIEECIGCGQCYLKCNFDVRDMITNERNVFVKTRSKKQARF